MLYLQVVYLFNTHGILAGQSQVSHLANLQNLVSTEEQLSLSREFTVRESPGLSINLIIMLVPVNSKQQDWACLSVTMKNASDQ